MADRPSSDVDPGRLAVVTGAAAGIGAATARLLATEGGDVVVADVDGAQARATADEINDSVGADRCTAVGADVSSEGGWDRIAAAASAVRPSGGIDLLVGNAVRQLPAPVTETSLHHWRQQIDVNLTGAFLGVRTLLPGLTAAGGNVVLVSSVHAVVGLPDHAAYAASKGGLTALTRQLAAELGPRIRVNVVLPGPILTQAWDAVSDDDRAASVRETIAGRFGEPHEVASVIAFLGSPAASYVTGSSVLVDGGWSVFKRSS